MLCSKIIFTREDIECSDRVSEFIKNKGLVCANRNQSDISEIEVEADDEELYGICRELTRYVRDKMIKSHVNKILAKEYACFNSDEKGIILANVFNSDFLGEIPGRMFVYLKINKRINPFAFYRFMCTDITNLIENATCAEADRILAVNDDADFVDLLKYFSQISAESSELIELTATEGEVRITDYGPGYGLNSTEYGYCDADVLAELVTMNPRKIEIKGKEEFLKTEIAGVITAVFQDRIYYK